MRRDDVTSHMSLAEEQLRAFLDDFQFKDIPDLADSSSLIGSTSWKKNLRVFPEIKSELLHIETLMDYSCLKFILLGIRCGSSPVPIPFHFVNLCQCEIFYRGRSSASWIM